MVYEAVILFGVIVFAKAAIMLVAIGIAKIPVDRFNSDRSWWLAQQVWGFLVLGTYFVYFWQKSGQTLPMQTWRIRLVLGDANAGARIAKAIARYFLAWMWFAPGLLAGHLLNLSGGPAVGLIALNMAAWAATAKLSKDGQFLHDRLAGTRLVSTLPSNELKPA